MSQTWLEEIRDVIYPPDPAPEPEPAPTPAPPEQAMMFRLISRVEDAHSELRALRGEIQALTDLCTEFLSRRARQREYQSHYDKSRRRQIIPMGKTWQDIAAMFEEYGERSAQEVSNRHHFSSNVIGYWMRAYAERTHRLDEYQDKVAAVYHRRSVNAAASKTAKRQ